MSDDILEKKEPLKAPLIPNSEFNDTDVKYKLKFCKFPIHWL